MVDSSGCLEEEKAGWVPMYEVDSRCSDERGGGKGSVG
jgi:hypothetical protein